MMQVDLELAACRAEVGAELDHQLSLRSRKRLLRSLESAFLSERAQAQRCRARIAIAVATRALPYWERHTHATHAQRMIYGAQGVLDGTMNRAALEQDAYEFFGGLQSSFPSEELEAMYAGLAAVKAAQVAVRDEYLYPRNGESFDEVDDPDDPDLFDCAF